MPRSWAFIVLPDTQYYLWKHPEVFLAQMTWIAGPDNPYSVQAVIHVGDIVQHNDEREWAIVRVGFNKLKRAEIPFVLTTGNHDYGPNGQAADRRTLLHQYFSLDDLKDARGAGALVSREIENSFIIVDTPKGAWLLLVLEFAPRQPAITWANLILTHYADLPAIVTTHAYLYPDGSRYDAAQKAGQQSWCPKTYGLAKDDPTAADGERLWQDCLRLHENVRLVLCGHALLGGVAYLMSRGRHGNAVHQILANYQTGVQPDHGEGGGGYLRILEFHAPGAIHVRTYSPWRDHWLETPEQDFVLPVPA